MTKWRTIRLSLETLDRIDKYRTYRRETYDDIINNVFNQVGIYKRMETMTNDICPAVLKKTDDKGNYLCLLSKLSVCPYKGNNKQCQIFVDAESM